MTPTFSAFAALFSEPCRALRSATATSLHQFEALFDSWLPPGCLAQADEGPHSRQRQWPLRLVFWTFCWQVAQAGTDRPAHEMDRRRRQVGRALVVHSASEARTALRAG